jgi:hypothetical protein
MDWRSRAAAAAACVGPAGADVKLKHKNSGSKTTVSSIAHIALLARQNKAVHRKKSRMQFVWVMLVQVDATASVLVHVWGPKEAKKQVHGTEGRNECGEEDTLHA